MPQGQQRTIEQLKQRTGVNDDAAIKRIMQAVQKSDTQLLQTLASMTPQAVSDMFRVARQGKPQTSTAAEPPWLALLRNQGVIR